MSRLMSLFRALQHGSTLADPANWKRRQVLIESLSGLLLAVAVFLPEVYRDQIDPALAQTIAAGIAAAVQLFVAPALTVATTEKLGVRVVGGSDHGSGGASRVREAPVSEPGRPFLDDGSAGGS